MRKLVLVKYAPEIFLKGLNRNRFEKKLKDNIKKVLEGTNYEFVVDQGRWFIYSEELEEVVNKVVKVFGISEICIVTEVEASMDEIKKQALEEVKEIGSTTFKVETNRANKSFPGTSMDISREIGAYILKNAPGLTVQINKPEHIINVEIRERAYVYSKRIKAVGGLSLIHI